MIEEFLKIKNIIYKQIKKNNFKLIFPSNMNWTILRLTLQIYPVKHLTLFL